MEFGFRTLKAGVRTEYSKRNYNTESWMLTGDLKIAEKFTDKGNAMFIKMSEVYLNEYIDISSSEDGQGQYLPGIAHDSAFPHST